MYCGIGYYMDTWETLAPTSAVQPSAVQSEIVTSEVEGSGSPSAPTLTLAILQRLATLARCLKVVAHTTRLRILAVLVQHPVALCVCESTDQFPLQQPTISHHLRLLREAGLIATHKRGTWSYYWATEQGKRVLASVESLA
jgi:ArsR family transcriptional regulator